MEISTSHEAKFIATLKSAIACIFFLFRNWLSLWVCMCSRAHAYGNTHEQACAHTCMHAHVTSYLWLSENNFEELSSSVTPCASWRLSIHPKACTGRAFTCFSILLALELSILSSPCITVLIGLAASWERLLSSLNTTSCFFHTKAFNMYPIQLFYYHTIKAYLRKKKTVSILEKEFAIFVHREQPRTARHMACDSAC